MGRPLAEQIKDLWLLASTAVEAGRVPQGQAYADEAMSLSTWQRYPSLGAVSGVQLRAYEGVPRGWVYYARRNRWDQLLLVHPDAREFVAETVGLAVVVRTARATGLGLMRLDPLLAAVVHAAFEVPDAL